jgi:hypothetical protein
MFELDNITGGIGELGFFDNFAYVWVFKFVNITGAIGELDFFDKIGFV